MLYLDFTFTFGIIGKNFTLKCPYSLIQTILSISESFLNIFSPENITLRFSYKKTQFHSPLHRMSIRPWCGVIY